MGKGAEHIDPKAKQRCVDVGVWVLCFSIKPLEAVALDVTFLEMCTLVWGLFQL